MQLKHSRKAAPGRRIDGRRNVAADPSCGASNTVDFLYVTSNLLNPGQINAYEVNSESGAIHPNHRLPLSLRRPQSRL